MEEDRVNARKTKIMICATGLDLLQSSGEFSYVICRTGVGSNSTFCNCSQVLGAREMQWAQALDKGPWLQMYMVPGNCTPLGWQTTEGSPSRTWQARGDSFLLLPSRHALSSWWLWTFNHNTWKPPEVQGGAATQFSLPTTSLSRHGAACTALVCKAQCSMPVRLGHWQSQTSNVCSEMTGQWSDRSAMSSRKTLSLSDPKSYLLAWHWGSGPHSEGKKALLVWTCGTLQWCSWQPLTNRLIESVGLGGQRRHGSSGQRGIAESGSRLWTLMIDIPGDLVWDLPYMQQGSYLEGGALMWMLPLYLHVNQHELSADSIAHQSDLGLHCLLRPICPNT